MNALHADAAPCLLVGCQLVCAVAEKCFGERRKHSQAYPENSIRRLLAAAGLRLRDVTHFALARAPSGNRAAKMAYVAKHPMKAARAVVKHLVQNRRTQSTLEQLSAVCGEDPTQVSFETIGVVHHLAHIASAYYLSPFKSLTTGFSYDASGDFASMMATRCENMHSNG